VGQSLKGEDVVAVLEAIKTERALPQVIKVDNAANSFRRRWIDGLMKMA
jgi:hypothetical protein